MPKKMTALEMLAALPSGKALQEAGELKAFCSVTAKQLASEIVLLADKLRKGDVKAVESRAELAVSRFLEEELYLFAIRARLILAKSESVRSRVMAASGKASAAKRSPSSSKAKFLAWAANDAKSNPRASPSSIVERFIKEHPEVKRFSFESGLRYLRPSSKKQ